MTLIIANISEQDAAELAEVLNERFPYEYQSAPMPLAAGSRVTSGAPIDRELLAALERRRTSQR